MILVQVSVSKLLPIFQRLQIALALRACEILILVKNQTVLEITFITSWTSFRDSCYAKVQCCCTSWTRKFCIPSGRLVVTTFVVPKKANWFIIKALF